MQQARERLKASGAVQPASGASWLLNKAVSTLAALLPSSSSKEEARRRQKWDEVKLWHLGYRQALPRNLTFLNNAGCSFSVLSFFALVESYSTQGLAYGGPVVVIWGWIVTSVASLCVAACLAELVSAWPTSGGLYFFANALAPPSTRAAWCWFTGWLNLLGQVAFTSSLEISLARYVTSLIDLHALGVDNAHKSLFSPHHVLLIFFGLVAAHTLMNYCSQRITAGFFTFSSLWHIIATASFCGALIFTAPSHQSNEYVFREWTPNTDIHGVENPVYVILIGLLMSQWIIMGFDSSVQLCEETINADSVASWSVVASVFGCSSLGLGLLLTLTYTMQSADSLLNTDRVAISQLTWDVYAARYGNGRLCLPLLYIPLVALFFCAFTSLASSGRSIYAFSRDGAMCGSSLWKQVNPNTGMPVYGISFMALLSFLMGVPAIYVKQVFQTISATSVVALLLSYGIPILLRLFQGHQPFIPGPFSLGAWSRWFGLVSCVWIAMVSVVFCLPSVYPIEPASFNYTPIMVAVLLGFAWIMWAIPYHGGKHWFKGPTANVDFMDESATQPSTAPAPDCTTPAETALPKVSEEGEDYEGFIDRPSLICQSMTMRRRATQVMSNPNLGVSPPVSRNQSTHRPVAKTMSGNDAPSSLVSKKSGKLPSSLVSMEMLDIIMDFTSAAARPVAEPSVSGKLHLLSIQGDDMSQAGSQAHSVATRSGAHALRLLSSVAEISGREHPASENGSPTAVQPHYTRACSNLSLLSDDSIIQQHQGTPHTVALSYRTHASSAKSNPNGAGFNTIGSMRRQSCDRGSAHRVNHSVKLSFLGEAAQQEADSVVDGSRLTGQGATWILDSRISSGPRLTPNVTLSPVEIAMGLIPLTALPMQPPSQWNEAGAPGRQGGRAVAAEFPTSETQVPDYAKRYTAALSSAAAKRVSATLRASSSNGNVQTDGMTSMTTIFSKMRSWFDPRIMSSGDHSPEGTSQFHVITNPQAGSPVTTATHTALSNKTNLQFTNAPDLCIPSRCKDVSLGAGFNDEEQQQADQAPPSSSSPAAGRSAARSRDLTRPGARE